MHPIVSALSPASPSRRPAARPPRRAPGRRCRQLSRKTSASIARRNSGALKRACRTDVPTTIVKFCKRQESGDCLGL
jgi:hypothetical protein